MLAVALQEVKKVREVSPNGSDLGSLWLPCSLPSSRRRTVKWPSALELQ